MTTTEMIELLKSVERGASGRSREIDLSVDGKFLPSPLIRVSSTGDGIAGAELCLDVESDREPVEVDEVYRKAEAFDSIFKLYIGYEDGWIYFPKGSKSFNKEIINVCKYYERGA